MTLVRGEHCPRLFFGPTLMMCEHLVASADAVGTLASPSASLELTHSDSAPLHRARNLSGREIPNTAGQRY